MNHAGHDHDSAQGREAHGLQGGVELTPLAVRARAIEALLIEKGVFTREEIQRVVDITAARSPAEGARLVARAWVDPAFKARLLADPKAAAAELGIEVAGEARLVVFENTENVHYLVVCTLCSCYPRTLLGVPPDWYKSLSYRSRAVLDPRGVMREFGLELDAAVEVRVLDSTADIRYLILPRRPPGTDRLTEEELARLVTRDSMIGVADPRFDRAPPR
ncbi:MAG: nitrile hydratase subunit alpha [Candidatus Rokubacteria bacterium]|nr:nitrile hydratase subunit alpha [Candidatus Rokubacteria bacterium]